MAKRGIDEHPKVIDFAEALGIPVCYAVGPLELFWHWVAKYRPNGDITGIKPHAIAHSIRFPGDAKVLMDALVGSGLVDDLGDRRIVHDWSEHADNAVHQLLKKRGEQFADGSNPFSRNSRREAVSQPEEAPVPTPVEPENVGSQTVHKQDTNGSRLPEPEPEPVVIDTLPNARDDENENPRSEKFQPPTMEEVLAYCPMIPLSEEEGRKFWFHYNSFDWKVEGRQVLNWRSLLGKWKITGAKFDKSPPGRGQPPKSKTAVSLADAARALGHSGAA